MGNLEQLIFILFVGFWCLTISLYGILCVIKGKINKIAPAYGMKREIVSFKKNPRAAVLVIILHLICIVLVTVPMIIAILIYLGIVK